LWCFAGFCGIFSAFYEYFLVDAYSPGYYCRGRVSRPARPPDFPIGTPLLRCPRTPGDGCPYDHRSMQQTHRAGAEVLRLYGDVRYRPHSSSALASLGHLPPEGRYRRGVLFWAKKALRGGLAGPGDHFTVVVERRVTSWAPPSTMEVAETRVSLASRWRSGMVMTPQLHMVDLTLYKEASTLSWRGPA